MTSRTRLHLAALLFSSWMLLLLTGWALGGGAHLLLAAALAAFPWRAVGEKPPGGPDPGGPDPGRRDADPDGEE